jgi:hypothetical protein
VLWFDCIGKPKFLGTTAVILQKENKCIISHTFLFKRIHYPSNSLIHAVNHCSLNFHKRTVPTF